MGSFNDFYLWSKKLKNAYASYTDIDILMDVCNIGKVFPQ